MSSECASKGKKAITIVGLPSQQDALTQLTSGRLDAAFGDTPVMSYAVLQQQTFRIAGGEVRPLPITLSTKKGKRPDAGPGRRDEAHRHLAEYGEIFRIWGLPHATIDAVEIF